LLTLRVREIARERCLARERCHNFWLCFYFAIFHQQIIAWFQIHQKHYRVSLLSCGMN